MGQKWFWGTLAVWCLLGAAGAWALFFPSLQPASQTIAQFSTQINGWEEKNEISQGFEALDASLAVVTKRWEAEGWHRLTKSLDLAPALLGIPIKDGKGLSSFLQVEAFQDRRRDSLRLLGLVKDLATQRTYQWTVEIPRKALHPADPSLIDFPLRPPSSASNLLSLATEKVRVLAWDGLRSTDPEGYFGRFFASQGFEVRILTQAPQETVLLLQRGATKLMAIVGQGGGKDTVALLELHDFRGTSGPYY
jgi:hypothetical protein